MQPSAVAVGLTVTILALTALLAGPHVAYLAPHTRVLATQYWPALTAYGVGWRRHPRGGDLRHRAGVGPRRPWTESGSGGTVDPARRRRRSGAGRTDAAAGPGRF